MELEVIKFGGSSLANNEKIALAVKQTTLFLKEKKKVIVVVSAQGNTTDRLIEAAHTLNSTPDKRELDMLVSVGEQISCSKFAIFLQKIGYKAISLTGWQAGILTDSNYTQAKIISINTKRIEAELYNNDVIVIAGFQGIDINQNITTLGRDGSDTTAVSIASALKLKRCYIFTDIDGIYDSDPKNNKNAKKLSKISYTQMKKLAEKGAKVLHKACIEIAEENDIKIIVAKVMELNSGSVVN